MWVAIDRDEKGYVVVGERELRRFKRKDALYPYVEKCEKVFVRDRKGFISFLNLDEELAEKVVDTGVLGENLSPFEFREIAQSLSLLGLDVSKIFTVSGLALQVRLLIPEKFLRLTAEEKLLADLAFFGGRTENFVKEEEGNITAYDINSSYPFVMTVFPYPDTTKPPMRIRKTTPSEVRKLYRKGYAGLCKVRAIETSLYPRLPVRVRTKGEEITFYPRGEIEGWFTSVDVMTFSDEECEVIEGLFYPLMKSPFVKYISRLYAVRRIFKREGKKAEKVVKGIMNVLYGLVSKKESYSSNRILGAFITAYQRARLYHAITTAERCSLKVLYCDTDSIWVSGKEERKAELEKLLRVGKGGKFGNWEVRESGVSRFKCFRPKAYEYEVGGRKFYVVSGLPRGSRVVEVREDGITYEVVKSVWGEKKCEREFLKLSGIERRKFSEDGKTSIPFSVEEVRNA